MPQNAAAINGPFEPPQRTINVLLFAHLDADAYVLWQEGVLVSCEVEGSCNVIAAQRFQPDADPGVGDT